MLLTCFAPNISLEYKCHIKAFWLLDKDGLVRKCFCRDDLGYIKLIIYFDRSDRHIFIYALLLTLYGEKIEPKILLMPKLYIYVQML
jgi:hypothetical protein